MEKKTRQCQNCRQNFTIEPEDFDFYEKIKVLPPTFCPECRLQRRLTWMVSLILFKRKCDLCGEEGISMYEPTDSFKVYCHKCWWSDKWDARDYATEIDFSKPFLEQWKELLHKTPILGLSIDTITGEFSPYTNHCGHAKNCYMIYYSDHNENSMNSFYLTRTNYVLNCALVADSEFCFDLIHGYKNYHVIGGSHAISSINSFFLRDSYNCQNCFGSANLYNKKYVFLNEQLTSRDYSNKINSFDTGSFEDYQRIKTISEENWKKFSPRTEWMRLSTGCSGNYVFQSKNCQECFEVTNAQDSKYLMLIKTASVKDSYDYTDWGENAERLYECMTVGCNVQDVRFTHESGFGLFDLQYCKLSIGGSHHFGCVSVKKTDYCILNKQYTREEYETLVPKIIKHMNEMPYVDKAGRVYKYGEFFPMEFSPHAYNDSFANFFFPKTKEEVLKDGLRWRDPEVKEYPITIPSSALPGNIKDTTEEIIKEVVGCGTCPKGYKIIKQELDLSKKLNVPLSRQCPFCRIGEKVNEWVSQMKQADRICDKCSASFKTHYSVKEAPTIWCPKCYKQEVY